MTSDSSRHPVPKLLMRSGWVLLLTLLACAGLRMAEFHAARPAAAPAPAGFVCRSAHYILTAQVHAGS